jgi:ABC-type transporter Mla subunit MlaD
MSRHQDQDLHFDLAELWHSLSDLERALATTDERLRGRLEAIDRRLGDLEGALTQVDARLRAVLDGLPPREPWEDSP